MYQKLINMFFSNITCQLAFQNAPIQNLALEQLILLIQHDNPLLFSSTLTTHQETVQKTTTAEKTPPLREHSSTNSSTSSIRSRSSSSGFDELSTAEAVNVDPKQNEQKLATEVPAENLIQSLEMSRNLEAIEFVDEEDSDEDTSLLQTCKIAIFGAPKVGKTQLVRHLDQLIKDFN
jgi:hypothetical protein